MALELNIKKCWFHNKNNFPHYDIPKLRKDEIEEKCEHFSTKQIITMIKESLNES